MNKVVKIKSHSIKLYYDRKTSHNFFLNLLTIRTLTEYRLLKKAKKGTRRDATKYLKK